MSDQKVPTAPDYSPMTTAFQGIADYAKQHGQEALDWAKGQFANNSNLTDQVNKGLLDLQNKFTDAAGTRLNQAGDAITSGISNLKDQYDKYTNPARKAADMGAAEATAAQGNEAARNASMSNLESYGLNPGAVRYGGLDASARLQDAATRVGAGNVASRTDDALADTTNQQILGEGNALAGQANTNASTGATTGTGAVNNNLNTTASGQTGMGTDLAWTGQGTQALGGAVNSQNTGFGNQAESDKIANSSSSGIGSLLGIGASMLGKGGAFGAGGALASAAPAALAFLADGGAVPIEASPSNGQVTDDVTASGPGGGGAIRLNAGEFVIPKDVVSWEGEKSLQNLIMKARKAKDEAQAKPKVQAPGGPDPASPAFQARPQAPQGQGALPV